MAQQQIDDLQAQLRQQQETIQQLINQQNQGVEAVVVPFEQPIRGSRLAIYEPFGALSLTGWMQQFDNFCACSLIPEEPRVQGVIGPERNQRRAVFLSYMGDRAYEVLRQACLPALPHNRPISDLMAILQLKFENPGLVETNRQRFHNRKQADTESAQDFVYALQTLAADCQFDAASYSAVLKSRLIGGLKSEATRERLLMDSTNMSFDQTKTLFIQIESIREQSRIMAQSNTIHATTECEPFHERVQAVFQRRGGGSSASRRGQQRRLGGAAFRPPGVGPTTPIPRQYRAPDQECWRCGKPHNPAACPAREWYCFQCLGKGHTTRKTSDSPLATVRPHGLPDTPHVSRSRVSSLRRLEREFWVCTISPLSP